MARKVGPSPSTTPVPTGVRPAAPRALPDDLLREATRRLGIVSLMGAFLWITAWGLHRFAMQAMSAEHPLSAGLQVPDYIDCVGAMLSVLLFVYTRKSKRPSHWPAGPVGESHSSPGVRHLTPA